MEAGPVRILPMGCLLTESETENPFVGRRIASSEIQESISSLLTEKAAAMSKNKTKTDRKVREETLSTGSSYHDALPSPALLVLLLFLLPHQGLPKPP